jgi:death-on-curing protein
MMDAPIFLSIEEVVEIHQDQVARYGGSPGIRDRALLESAVHAPAASFGGQYVHGDLFAMAAAYLFHLVKNHAFADGNKRVGAAAADVFLQLNGWDLANDEPAFSDLVLAVATGTADKGVVADYLRTRSSSLP